MKRVGILTFHKAVNYGAVLQCYALQEFLKGQGFDTKVIDYHPDFKKRRGSIINTNPILNFARKIYVNARDYSPSRIAWTYTFRKFVKRKLDLSPKCIESTIPDCFDAYVIGSDQLWNYSITGGPHKAYFAVFPFAKGPRKYISYAVSMELTSVSEEDKENTVRYLNNFDAISVREMNAVSFLRQLTGKPITKTIDPTLLADKEIWNDFLRTPRIKEKYVLIYQVRVNGHTRKVAEEIAKQRNATIIEIASGLTKPEGKALEHISPEEFVGWFKNAEAIITTSFHGTAFSLIFNKPFYTIRIGDGWDNRVGNLLRDLGLEDRSVGIGKLPKFSNIDYTIVNERMSQIQKESALFLLNNI